MSPSPPPSPTSPTTFHQHHKESCICSDMHEHFCTRPLSFLPLPCYRYAPSFNTAAGIAIPAAAGPDSSSWVLQGNMPKMPTAQLIGPHVRFNDYEPATGTLELSILVVSHPSLSSSTVQLHFAVNGPAMNAAASQVLDEILGWVCCGCARCCCRCQLWLSLG